MGLFDRFFGGNNDKKTNRQTQQQKNQAAFDDRMQSPFERQALDKQVIDAIKAKRGIQSLTTDDINRDYGRAKANLEKVLTDYGRGAKTSGGGQFGDGTRDFTPTDFDSQGNLRFFSANKPTFRQMLGDVGRSGFIPQALSVMGGPLTAAGYFGNQAINNAGGLGSLFSKIGESLGLNKLQQSLLGIKGNEQLSTEDSLKETIYPGNYGGVYDGESLPPQGAIGMEDMSALEEFSNFNQVPPGYQFQERDPTGMGGAEGTLYDPTTIGGMKLFPNTPPPGTEVSQTDYSGERTSPFSTQTGQRQNIFEENNPGDLNVYSQRVNEIGNPYMDSDGAMVFNPAQYPLGNVAGGFAYGGDINRATMNSQSLSASDNIDDRIMKNLQFEQKAPGMMGYNQGGQAMSTYEKLKMINDSVAQG